MELQRGSVSVRKKLLDTSPNLHDFWNDVLADSVGREFNQVISRVLAVRKELPVRARNPSQFLFCISERIARCVSIIGLLIRLYEVRVDPMQ